MKQARINYLKIIITCYGATGGHLLCHLPFRKIIKCLYTVENISTTFYGGNEIVLHDLRTKENNFTVQILYCTIICQNYIIRIFLVRLSL